MSSTVPPLVDRLEELDRFRALLEDAMRGRGCLVFVRGEPGIGKTRLAQAVALEARARGFSVGFGTGLAESVVLYHSWSEALRQVDLLHLLDEVPSPKLLAIYLVTDAAHVVAEGRRSPSDVSVETFRTWRSQFEDFVRRRSASEAGIQREGDLASWASDDRRLIVRSYKGLNACAVLDGRESETFLADLQGLAKSSRDARDPKPLATRFVTSEEYGDRDVSLSDPQLRRMRLFENLLQGLARSSSLEPLLLVLDDLQWADPSSLGLLHYVARNVTKSRLILVGAYRTETGATRPHLKETLTEMAHQGFLSEMVLTGLPHEYIRDLATSFLGKHQLADVFLDLLWSETEGNPLFVREVLRGLEDERRIRVRGGAKRLSRPIARLDVSQRVRGVIRARLDRLPKSDRALLDAAAACGARFTATFVANVAGQNLDRTARTLESIAQVHGLLQTTASGYAFNHSEIQGVIYENLAPEVRKTYHLKAAEWLELAGAPAEDVAEQYYLGGDARAVPRLLDAALRAADKFANEEAVRFYSEALELATQRDQRFQALSNLARVRELMGDFRRSLESNAQALSLAGNENEKSLILKRMGFVCRWMGKYAESLRFSKDAWNCVRGTGSAEEAYALRNLGGVLAELCKPEKALDHLQRSLEIFERIGDATGIAATCSSIGLVHCDLSEYEQSAAWSERALRLCQELAEESGVITCLNNLGVVHQQQGRYDAALGNFRKCLEFAAKRGQRDFMANSHDNLGAVYCRLGDFEEAISQFQSGLSLFEQTGSQRGVADCLRNIGRVHLALGDFKGAAAFCEKGLKVAAKSRDARRIAETCLCLAEARLGQHKIKEALRLAQRAHALSTKTGSKRLMGESRRVLGMTLREQRKWAESILQFEDGIRIFESIEQDSLADTHYQFGLMWLMKRSPSQARNHLRAAYALFKRLGRKVDQEKATEALTRVERRRSRNA